MQKLITYAPIGSLLVALLALCYTILKDWRDNSDVVYEQGAYYRYADHATTSLSLTNLGRRNAKNVVVSAFFPAAIVAEPITNDDAYPFTVTSGGRGRDAVSGTLDRLGHGQTIDIFFDIGLSKGRPVKAEFVQSIMYDEGKARAKGEGSYNIISMIVATLATLLSIGFTLYKFSRDRDEIQAADEAVVSSVKALNVFGAQMEVIKNSLQRLAPPNDGAEAEAFNELKRNVEELSREANEQKQELENDRKDKASIGAESALAIECGKEQYSRSPDGDVEVFAVVRNVGAGRASRVRVKFDKVVALSNKLIASASAAKLAGRLLQATPSIPPYFTIAPNGDGVKVKVARATKKASEFFFDVLGDDNKPETVVLPIARYEITIVAIERSGNRAEKKLLIYQRQNGELGVKDSGVADDID